MRVSFPTTFQLSAQLNVTQLAKLSRQEAGGWRVGEWKNLGGRDKKSRKLTERTKLNARLALRQKADLFKGQYFG